MLVHQINKPNQNKPNDTSPGMIQNQINIPFLIQTNKQTTSKTYDKHKYTTDKSLNYKSVQTRKLSLQMFRHMSLPVVGAVGVTRVESVTCGVGWSVTDTWTPSVDDSASTSISRQIHNRFHLCYSNVMLIWLTMNISMSAAQIESNKQSHLFLSIQNGSACRNYANSSAYVIESFESAW